MSRTRSSGFTLIELMATIGLLGFVSAAASTLYLEARVAFARDEAQLRLQREAVLAAEWIARDLRSAGRRQAEGGQDTLTIEVRDGGLIRYRVEARRLIREGGDGSVQAVADGLLRLGADRVPGSAATRGGFRVVLEFEALAASGRPVRLARTFWIGWRE